MQKLILLLIFQCADAIIINSINDILLNMANVRLSTMDLIIRDGYRVEDHEVKTDDGYIINIQRIPRKSDDSIPVLIIHGLCADSHIWVLNGKNHSLPYFLSDNDFDVWLGNVRGNSYGKRHINLSPNDDKFWNFSIDELAFYDLPAIISYINKLTHEQIVYIGYSMSANVGLIMNTIRHDMDSKVRLMIHLGPPVFMNTATIASNRWIPLFNHIKTILDSFKIYQWPPAYRFIKYIAKNICTSNNITMKICEEMILSSFNFDRNHVSHFTLEMIVNHITDTTSTMVINHFVQWIESGHFRQYNYGMINNIKKYNRITPPHYNISEINIPTAIFYTETDDYVSSEAIERLYYLLPYKAGIFKINNDKFSHLHFGFATNAYDLVYEKILNIIKIFH